MSNLLLVIRIRSAPWREALSTIDMRALEINSAALGVSTLLLMENAGRSVAEVVASRLDRSVKIAVVAGRGGKAGDGFVAARHLRGLGFYVEIFLTSDPEAIRHEDAKRNYEILSRGHSVKISRYERGVLKNFDVVIDAMLGTGVRGRVRGVIADAINEINNLGKFVVAIDVPSGLDPDTGEILGECVNANVTVTMHAPKKGLVNKRECVGELIVADIGIPAEAWEDIGPGDVEARILKREKTAKKGDAGRILVIAGSENYVGAPWITALAAWSAGSDLVYLASPRKVLDKSFSPEIIPIELGEKYVTREAIDVLRDHIAKADAVAIGPGVGLFREVREAIPEIINETLSRNKPMVIDADALKILAENRIKLKWRAVLTPHLGEASILLRKELSNDKESRVRAAKEISEEFEAVVIVKGYLDAVCESSRCRVRSLIGNPDMARGGTGDVLTGIVASLIPRTRTLFDAACAGVAINAIAGEIAYRLYGASTPMNLIKLIPRVIKDPLKYYVEALENRSRGS